MRAVVFLVFLAILSVSVFAEFKCGVQCPASFFDDYVKQLCEEREVCIPAMPSLGVEGGCTKKVFCPDYACCSMNRFDEISISNNNFVYYVELPEWRRDVDHFLLEQYDFHAEDFRIYVNGRVTGDGIAPENLLRAPDLAPDKEHDGFFVRSSKYEDTPNACDGIKYVYSGTEFQVKNVEDWTSSFVPGFFKPYKNPYVVIRVVAESSPFEGFDDNFMIDDYVCYDVFYKPTFSYGESDINCRIDLGDSFDCVKTGSKPASAFYVASGTAYFFYNRSCPRDESFELCNTKDEDCTGVKNDNMCPHDFKPSCVKSVEESFVGETFLSIGSISAGIGKMVLTGGITGVEELVFDFGKSAASGVAVNEIVSLQGPEKFIDSTLPDVVANWLTNKRCSAALKFREKGKEICGKSVCCVDALACRKVPPFPVPDNWLLNKILSPISFIFKCTATVKCA